MAVPFACRLALLVFAATALEQIWSVDDLSAALGRVLTATAVFFGLGLICGEMARRLAEEQAQREVEAAQAQAVLTNP